MIKLNSFDEVVIVSSGAQLRARAVKMLKHACDDVQELSSLEKFVGSAVRRQAIVMVEDCLSNDILEQLRHLSDVKNLVLVSSTQQEQTIVTALYNGASFYFDINESDLLLAARLQAALRTRSEKVRTDIHAPPYDFDVQRRQVFLNNQHLALTPMEYKFAEYLFSRPEEVVPKSELMRFVWSLPQLNNARRVTTAACQVRRKMHLGSHQSGWRLKNIRNIGFKLTGLTAF